MRKHSKTAAEVDFYSLDFSNDIPADDPIDEVSWTVPSGLTDSDDEFTGYVAQVKLAGGVLDDSYVVTATATTEAGRVVQKSFELTIVEF